MSSDDATILRHAFLLALYNKGGPMKGLEANISKTCIYAANNKKRT